MEAFLRQTEAPEVRCDLTNRHTDRHGNYCNPRCACVQRVNYGMWFRNEHMLDFECAGPVSDTILRMHCWLAAQCILHVANLLRKVSFHFPRYLGWEVLRVEELLSRCHCNFLPTGTILCMLITKLEMKSTKVQNPRRILLASYGILA